MLLFGFRFLRLDVLKLWLWRASFHVEAECLLVHLFVLLGRFVVRHMVNSQSPVDDLNAVEVVNRQDRGALVLVTQEAETL